MLAVGDVSEDVTVKGFDGGETLRDGSIVLFSNLTIGGSFSSDVVLLGGRTGVLNSPFLEPEGPGPPPPRPLESPSSLPRAPPSTFTFPEETGITALAPEVTLTTGGFFKNKSL